jgi:hypothetical protein
MNPGPHYKFPKYVAKLTSHIDISLPKGTLPRDFSNKAVCGIYVASNACYLSHHLHTSGLSNLNYTTWSPQIMKLCFVRLLCNSLFCEEKRLTRITIFRKRQNIKIV